MFYTIIIKYIIYQICINYIYIYIYIYVYIYAYMYICIYMMMMKICFYGMVDQRKAFNLISSHNHCQRSSP